MTAVYSYNCSNETYKHLIEDLSLTIKKSLESGNTIWNKNIDFEKKKIVFTKKKLNDVVKIVDYINEQNINKFLQKLNSKQSILFIFSKKNKLAIFNFDHAVVDGLGTLNFCGDMIKLLTDKN